MVAKASQNVRPIAKARKVRKSQMGKAPQLNLYDKFPNMKMPAFQAAVAVAKFNGSKLYSTMPTHEELNTPKALHMLGVINGLLDGIEPFFQRTWTKMLQRAFPELRGHELAQMLQIIVVRCWTLRIFKCSNLHDFVEFCAGQGNLSRECLLLGMFGATLDIDYTPDHNMMTAKGLRIMIDCISRSKILALNWWGTKCSSHVPACYFHHQRKEANGFWGDQSLDWVRNGNLQQVPLCGMVANAG